MDEYKRLYNQRLKEEQRLEEELRLEEKLRLEEELRVQEEQRKRYEEEELRKLQHEDELGDEEELRKTYEEEQIQKLRDEEELRLQRELRKRYEMEELQKLRHEEELRKRYEEEELQKLRLQEELRRRYEEEVYYYNWYTMYGYGPLDPRTDPRYHFNMLQQNRPAPEPNLRSLSNKRRIRNEPDSTSKAIEAGCSKRSKIVTTVTTSTIVQRTEAVDNNSLKISFNDGKVDATKMKSQNKVDSQKKYDKTEKVKHNEDKAQVVKKNEVLKKQQSRITDLKLVRKTIKSDKVINANKSDDNTKTREVVDKQRKCITNEKKMELTRKIKEEKCFGSQKVNQKSREPNEDINKDANNTNSSKTNKISKNNGLEDLNQLSDDDLYDPSQGIDILPDEGVVKRAPREDCSDVSDDEFQSVYDPEQSPLNLTLTDESDCEPNSVQTNDIPCSSTSIDIVKTHLIKIEENSESNVVSSSTCNTNPDELMLYDPYFGTFSTQTMVIIPVNYPIEKFTQMQQTLLKKTLLDKVLASKMFTPKFVNTRFQEGAMRVKCANDETRNWLLKIVPKIVPWDNAVLKVVSYEEVFTRKNVGVLIPDDCVDGSTATDVLKLLEKQNNGLNTEEWFVIDNVRSEDGLDIVFNIDHDSWTSLSNKNFNLFLGLGQIQFSEKIT